MQNQRLREQPGESSPRCCAYLRETSTPRRRVAKRRVYRSKLTRGLGMLWKWRCLRMAIVSTVCASGEARRGALISHPKLHPLPGALQIRRANLCLVRQSANTAQTFEKSARRGPPAGFECRPASALSRLLRSLRAAAADGCSLVEPPSCLLGDGGIERHGRGRDELRALCIAESRYEDV